MAEVEKRPKIAKWLYKSDSLRMFIKDYQSGACLSVKRRLFNPRKKTPDWKEIGYVYYNFKYNKFMVIRGFSHHTVTTLEEIQKALSVTQLTERMWQQYQAYMVGFKLNKKAK